MRDPRNCRYWDQPRYGMMREQRGMGRGMGANRGIYEKIDARSYVERPAETRPCYRRFAYANQRSHVEEALTFHEERLEELKERLSSFPKEDE